MWDRLLSPCQWTLCLDFLLSKYFRLLFALSLLLQLILAFTTDKMPGGKENLAETAVAEILI